MDLHLLGRSLVGVGGGGGGGSESEQVEVEGEMVRFSGEVRFEF